MARTRTIIEAIRTIIWFDFLAQNLGLTASGLDELYRSELERLGDDRALSESDNRMKIYRDGLSTPTPDRSGGMVPTVLEFFAEKVKDSERWFFLPLLNLLDGQVTSAVKVLNKIEEAAPITKDIFAGAFDDIRVLSAMKSRNQRNPPELPMVLTSEHSLVLEAPMTNIRSEMLRLDSHTVRILFENYEGRLYRRQRSAEDEVRELMSEVSLNRLTAAVGLALEAQLLGWRQRFHAVDKLLEFQLPALFQVPHLDRVADRLHKTIVRAFRHGVCVSYAQLNAEVFGYPESWAKWVFKRSRHRFIFNE